MYEMFESSQKLKQDQPKKSQGKYPWGELEVGKSFFIKKEQGVAYSTLLSLAYKTGKRLGRKFKVILHAEGIEVGRLDDPVTKSDATGAKIHWTDEK